MSEQLFRSREVNVGKEGSTPKELFGRKSVAKKVNLGEEGETPKKFIRSNSFEHRRVNVGLDGLTPKKVVNSDGTTRAYNFSKKVNVGNEGSTPIKTFEFYSNIPVAAAPNQANFAKTAPAISSSTIRQTINSAGASRNPSKTNPFSNGKFTTNPEIETEIISPGGRPKTSRGKSHPSPDEFFDYVVPSPPPAKHTTDRMAFYNENQQPAPRSELQSFSEDPEESDGADNYDMLDGIQEEDQDENNPAESSNIEGEESVYEVNSFEGDATEDELQQRHIGMKGADAQRNKQIRMLGCWLFGSALRI